MGLRLVMMGTGRFALPVFLALYDSPHEVVALFTGPDREAPGRRRHSNPLKEAAQQHGTPVFQPENVNAPAALDDLRRLRPDVCVVAAYGQILSPQLLEIPRLGAVNVHASLLPKYRGAAPVHYAILNGERETGVTIFQIEPKLDAGPILAVVRTPIGPKETTGELEQRLAEMAAPLLVQVIDDLAAGRAKPMPQNPQQVTRAPRLKKEDGAIDWNRSAVDIERHVRAMQPWPTAFTFLKTTDGRAVRVILLDVDVVDGTADAAPGEVIDVAKDRLFVQTGSGAVGINRLQPEGKRAMSIAEFLRGHAVHRGDRFGSQP